MKRNERRVNYTSEAIGKGVYRISESGADNCYLIEGSDYALLIDMGIGLGDLLGFLRSLTNLPIIAVGTHGHPDHIGGRGQFEEIYLHRDDVLPVNIFLCSYAVRRFFTHISRARTNINPRHVTKIKKKPDIIAIHDRHIFELGGRSVRVIHVPGHSAGSIALILDDEKMAFVGDALRTEMWVYTPGAKSVEEWIESAEKILSLPEDYVLYTGHAEDSLPREAAKEIISYGRELVAKTKRNKKLSVIRFYKKDKPSFFIIYRTGNVLKKKTKRRSSSELEI